MLQAASDAATAINSYHCGKPLSDLYVLLWHHSTDFDSAYFTTIHAVLLEREKMLLLITSINTTDRSQRAQSSQRHLLSVKSTNEAIAVSKVCIRRDTCCCRLEQGR